jgi:lipopolysaccharide transport system permease protein
MSIFNKLYKSLFANYNLIYQLTKRDILQRYRGQQLDSHGLLLLH